jgi:hypothetical protein
MWGLTNIDYVVMLAAPSIACSIATLTLLWGKRAAPIILESQPLVEKKEVGSTPIKKEEKVEEEKIPVPAAMVSEPPKKKERRKATLQEMSQMLRTEEG